MNLKHSSFFRIDEQVVYTMAAVCLISIFVLAFRFTTKKPCISVNITYQSDSVFVNDVVRFSAEKRVGSEYAWNFGDGSLSGENSYSVTHSYKEAKAYTVKVVLDEKCTDIQTLVVYEKKKITPPTLGPDPIFPETAFVNEEVHLSDASPYSTSWEWFFDGNPEVHSREREAKYTFKNDGSRKFTLKTNNKEELVVTRFIFINARQIDESSKKTAIESQPRGRRNVPTIVINDKPYSDPLDKVENKSVAQRPEPLNPEPIKVIKGTDVTEPQMENLLFQVTEGNKSANDFGGYLCDNLNIPVSYDNKQYTFSAFCNELRNIKAKKIKKITILNITKNQNNCILSMQVSIKKKFLSF